MITPIKLKSEFCLLPNQCYPIETELPIWFVAILTGATIFLLKEIYNSFN